MKLYAISGLGADERVFQFLKLNHKLIPLPWLTPEKNESIEKYAKRMAEMINTEDEFGILGLSFGGLVAVELSKLLNPKVTVLISSAETKDGLRSLYKLVGKTGIKEHSINKILRKFKDLGIIDYQIKGMPQVKHLRIIWDNILEMLPEIYQFDKVEEYFGGSTQPLIDFYKLLAENNEKIAENTEEKNSIKNKTEEYEEELKKEITANAIAEDSDAVNINKLKDFINNVEYYGHGKEYNESELIGALRVYDIENIMDMISYNAENNPFFDLKKLLRMTKKNKITAMENFIVEKKHQIEILLIKALASFLKNEHFPF